MNMKLMLSAALAALLLAGCATEQTGSSAAGSQPAPAASAPAGSQQVPGGSNVSIGLEDGTYTVDFVTDSKMFRANEAHDRKGTLTVRDGQGTLHVSLGSKNIVNLYPGLAADAQQDQAGWLQPTMDTVTYSDGLTEEVHGFDVPVPAVGQEFDLALIGKKGVWYDHKVSVQDPVPQAAPAPAPGSYTCQVALSGGSGRASICSPAALTVTDQGITATIVWSSPNYEYMLVDQARYERLPSQDSSTFEIPVVLDRDMAVSACTVAMSEPHLIDYTLRFDSATLTQG